MCVAEFLKQCQIQRKIAMQNKITSFTGKYEFLSNSYNSSFMFDGLPYFNAEAAFQAQKTTDQVIRLRFTDMMAYEAKRKGKSIQIRPGWKNIMDDVMYRVCKAKFTESELADKLRSTNGCELVYGNDCNDYYWGCCNGVGRNKLGRILMRIREEIL